MRQLVAAIVSMNLFVLTGAAQSSPQTGADVVPFSEAQWIYLERCGGCHGIQGRSAPALVPTLRGQVGYFLCTSESRAYLIRLPSVATAPISDRALASLMNFVVFDLGGANEARGQKYTEAEVGALRMQPLKDVALASYRAELVERLITQCGAPQALRQYSSERGK